MNIIHKKIVALIVFSTTCLLLYSSITNASFAPEWHMINVNHGPQGDAHLLIDSDSVVLIDTGVKAHTEQYVIPYLNNLSISHIDHIFISHPHTDHYGGLQSLCESDIQVKNIYFNLNDSMLDDFNFKRVDFLSQLEICEQTGSMLNNISEGFSLSFQNSSLSVIHSQKTNKVDGKSIDINDYSLIILWDAGIEKSFDKKFRTIFTGDLNLNLGTYLSDKEIIKADILKVPHHGVAGIAPDSFFDMVDANLSMFPSTQSLWWNSRGIQARKWVTENEKKFCHNGLNGNIVLKFYETIHVESEIPTDNCPNGNLQFSPKEKKYSLKKKTNFLPAILDILL